MLELYVLAAALVLDLAFGEPRNALHPVAWIGTIIGKARDLCPSQRPGIELCWGALMALGLPLGFAGVVYLLLQQVAGSLPLSLLVATLVLKSTFALRALGEAALKVERSLVSRDLAKAREGLRSLCSRDPSELSEGELVAATVESVAENASDSFVAPLFYYAIAGIPGAVFYRAVNTLDAMIGYRGRYEYLGKVSARLDDVLNFIPARLTALALLIAGALTRLDSRSGIQILLRDGRRTSSPNAGRPMATMAGLLRVQLEKHGEYALGDAREKLSAGTIDRAWRAVRVAGILVWGAASLALWVMHG